LGKGPSEGCTGLTSIAIPEAFHSQREANRLSVGHLWLNGFFFPSSVSRTPELSIRLPLQLILTGDQNFEAVIETANEVSGPWTEFKSVVIEPDWTAEIDWSNE
tara:strand:- start:2286 stop:2597 length:312 start_codon:yes stop_codon:yes gene_type:complete